MIKPKIFIIDDDHDVRELIVSYLGPRGYLVTGFEDAEAALGEIQKDPRACDVLITDLLLPKMDGFALIRTLKEKNTDIPIILMTANSSAESAIRAVQEGAYDFVVKPIHFAQLLVSIERALYFRKVREENSNLRAVVSGQDSFGGTGIVGRSPGFLRVMDLVRRVAPSSANIFISGESGSGKEVVARAIHQFSSRSKGAFVAINCSAIPETLLESELFGFVKGAFTGAIDKKIGLFEEAEGGTLFLDEIGDLSLPLQAKLLRVIQEKRIKRIGENQDRKVDVRIICATHRNLKKEIIEKNFREDLYFRIAVIPIQIPPLRERKDDILLLADFFLKKFVVLNRANISGFTKEAAEYLLRQEWPGNVRELENSIERAVVLRGTGVIGIEDLDFDIQDSRAFDAQPELPLEVGVAIKDTPEELFDPNKPLMSLHELTDQYIVFALKRNEGAKDRTAKVLGIDRKTLYRKIQDLEGKLQPLGG